jgi:hypothetical protein
MKIIQHGDKIRIEAKKFDDSGKKLFRCKTCDCMWIAEKDEYETNYNSHNCAEYKTEVTCPDCESTNCQEESYTDYLRHCESLEYDINGLRKLDKISESDDIELSPSELLYRLKNGIDL